MKPIALCLFACVCALCHSGCVMRHEPAPLKRSIEVGEVIQAQNKNVDATRGTPCNCGCNCTDTSVCVEAKCKCVQPAQQ